MALGMKICQKTYYYEFKGLSHMLNQIVLFTLIPSICMIIGGITAIYLTPSEKITVMTQHFAAGVVFAAVAKELVVKLGSSHQSQFSLVFGFMLGVGCMLLAKFISNKLEEKNNKLAIGFIVSVFIDIFIDGLLIGIAFLTGEKGGILITIALSIEITFLGVATSATLKDKNLNKLLKVLIILVLSLTIPVSAGLGLIFFKNLSPDLMGGVLAFGTSALLYLVTEELLVEAHQTEEKFWMPALFFLGFLLILILEN
ncbi:MAG: conserved rane protein of unknown function [Burkholderiales bacterium]|nr:conserved rane protein of unknown function [Burkholderiales bacterium]